MTRHTSEMIAMFYRYFEKHYQDNAIRKAREAGYLTEDDEQLIRQYVAEYRALMQVSHHRVQKATTDLVQWKRFIKVPYRSCTVQDVYEGITALQNGKSLKGKPFS